MTGSRRTSHLAVARTAFESCPALRPSRILHSVRVATRPDSPQRVQVAPHTSTSHPAKRPGRAPRSVRVKTRRFTGQPKYRDSDPGLATPQPTPPPTFLQTPYKISLNPKP